MMGHPVLTAMMLLTSFMAQTDIVSLPFDINGSSPDTLRATGHGLYFMADDGIHGRELWRLDPSDRLTLALDEAPGSADGDYQGVYGVGSMLVFAAPHRFNDLVMPKCVWQIGETDHRPRRHDVSMGGASVLWAWETGKACFVTLDTQETGWEMWAMEKGGGELTLLADIYAGPSSAVPQMTVPYLLGDRLFFFARVSESEMLLYQSDGTPDTTKPVLSASGAAVSFSRPIYWGPVFKGQFYFLVMTGEKERFDIYASDGTSEGTILTLENVYSVPGRTIQYGISDAHLFMALRTESAGVELWCTDGMQDGPRFVKDINPGPADSAPYQICGVGNRVVFTAQTADNGSEIWVSDGTEDGTQLLRDLIPGPADSRPYQLIAFKDWVLFSCSNPEFGEELWRTDGTADGTVLVKDINPGRESSEPYDLTLANGAVYFGATHAAYGRELWKTDGTTDGTELVARVRPNIRSIGSSFPALLTPNRGKLYFIATDRTGRQSLWCTDGLESNTVNVLPPEEAERIRDALQMDSIDTRLYIQTAEGQTYEYLHDEHRLAPVDQWPRTEQVCPLIELVDAETWESVRPTPLGPEDWLETSRFIFFAGYTPGCGYELWCYEHATGSFGMLADIFPGPGSSSPTAFTNTPGGVVFRAENLNMGVELWRTDGTTGGTQVVADHRYKPLGSVPRDITVWGDVITNVIMGSPEGYDIVSYAIPGFTRIPTQPLDLVPELGWHPQELTVYEGKLFFSSPRMGNGHELWVMDKPELPPRLVKDIVPNFAPDPSSGDWYDLSQWREHIKLQSQKN
ncbi:MAG: hypothetical protein AMXMBFR84_24770 [Candidatus Hydrogenedentota bacterium]